MPSHTESSAMERLMGRTTKVSDELAELSRRHTAALQALDDERRLKVLDAQASYQRSLDALEVEMHERRQVLITTHSAERRLVERERDEELDRLRAECKRVLASDLAREPWRERFPQD